MDREEARRRAEIMMAFANGSDVQFYNGVTKQWEDIRPECVLFESVTKYRIKPEPKYRPFYTQEECWNEMMKHQPFEWIVNQVGNKAKVLYIDTDFILVAEPCKIHSYDYDEALNYFKFVDGAPFGIKEE